MSETSGARRVQAASPMSVLGLSPDEEALYRLALRNSGNPVEQLAALRDSGVEQIKHQLARIMGLGLVNVVDGLVTVDRPDEAIGRLISDETRRLLAHGEQLAALRGLVPSLDAEYHAALAPRGETVTVEAVDLADVVDLIRSLSVTCSGDLVWLRPDQWRVPAGRALDAWVKDLLGEGRRSRAIYPARVLEEAPEVVHGRAEAGEHVRILAAVPVRLAVMGETVAVVPELWDSDSERVLVVRQLGLVRAMRLLFERLWERAMPVPGLDGQRVDDRLSERRLVLDQLAAGAKDEQIARALGMSLRTVRRRVAEVLDDLGVDSRFQAGVEAVRRGWL